MAVYAYRGRNSKGETVSGQIEAADRPTAMRLLYDQDLSLTALDPLHAKSAPGPSGTASAPTPGLRSLSVRVRSRTRGAFWRQLSYSLHAGVTMDAALAVSNRGFGRLSQFARDNHVRIGQGTPLSSAMAEHGELFSPLETALVRVGEASGHLDQALGRVANHFEREAAVYDTIRWRLLYLGLVGVVFVGVMFVLSVIAPYLAGQVDSMVPGVLRYAGLGLGLVAAWVGLRASYVSLAPVRRAWDAVRSNLPTIGPLVRKLALGRYARVLSETLEAGLPVGEAATLAASAAGNQHIAQALSKVPEQVRSGVGLTQALLGSGQLPAFGLAIITSGEQAGAVPDSLSRLADYLEQDATAATRTLVMMAFVGTILAAAVVVFFFALRFYVGYANDLLAFGE